MYARFQAITFVVIVFTSNGFSQQLYEIPPTVSTGRASFENPKATPGQGGRENKSAKGHAFGSIPAGASFTLLDVSGAGTVQRIWLAIDDRSPQRLRAMRIDAYWDGAAMPAVSAPLGDFFGLALGRKTAFENAFFSDPEGRSFNCTIPMPFRDGAWIVLTNESDRQLDMLFYDVNFLRVLDHPANTLYFHTHWNRVQRTELGKDFNILPNITGKGRFLGANLSVQANPLYGQTWWGEGEVKLYVDTDDQFPSFVGCRRLYRYSLGTGGLRTAVLGQPHCGRTKAAVVFYRYHIPDPVYFQKALRVTIQAIGGGPQDVVRILVETGVPLQPVTLIRGKASLFVYLTRPLRRR